MPEPEEAQPGEGERRPWRRLGARGKRFAAGAGIGLGIALAGGGVAMAAQGGTDSNTETDSGTEAENGTQEGSAEDCPDRPGDRPGRGEAPDGGDGLASPSEPPATEGQSS